MDVDSLIRRASEIRPEPARALQELIIAVKQGELGLRIVEYPIYRLKRSARKRDLPTGGYLHSAVLSLRESGQALPLDQIVEQHLRKCVPKSVARSPEFWMYKILEDEGAPFLARSGKLRIGLRAEVPKKQAPERPAPKAQRTSRAPAEPIGRGIDEKSLETLLVNRLDLLEPGLQLIKRQFSIEFGVIDLLCLDRKRNLVVVELKRPRADSRAVVGQIAAYMGWIRKHMAGPAQIVRGIIVVGREDKRLKYSLDLLDNIIVRPFY